MKKCQLKPEHGSGKPWEDLEDLEDLWPLWVSNVIVSILVGSHHLILPFIILHGLSTVLMLWLIGFKSCLCTVKILYGIYLKIFKPNLSLVKIIGC